MYAVDYIQDDLKKGLVYTLDGSMIQSSTLKDGLEHNDDCACHKEVP